MTERRSTIRGYLIVVGVTLVASVLLGLLRLPSAVLFGGLIGGIVQALFSTDELPIPRSAFRLSQAMVGVITGAGISLASLSRMGSDAVVIVLVTLGTIAISLVAGRVLALRAEVSRVTGAFSLIAGGASGVTAIAHELGADARVVTVVQYLRVLVVLVTLPVVSTVVFHAGHGHGSLHTVDAALLPSLAYVALAVGIGLVIARLVPLTTSVLLGPMLVAAVLSTSGWLGDVAVPAALQWIAFAMIGAQVGLRFTRQSLASITRMLPAVLALVVGMVLATALMGSLLAALTPVDGLTAYLATTPGGLFAVLATAADAGSDTTYVMAVQVVRLLAILAFTPLLARLLTRTR